MSARDELAVLIAKHHDKFFGVEYAEPATQDTQLADHLIEEGWTRPRIITAVEELDALDYGTVIHCAGDLTAEADGDQTFTLAPSPQTHKPVWRNHWITYSVRGVFGDYKSITVLLEPTA